MANVNAMTLISCHEYKKNPFSFLIECLSVLKYNHHKANVKYLCFKNSSLGSTKAKKPMSRKIKIVNGNMYSIS